MLDSQNISSPPKSRFWTQLMDRFPQLRFAKSPDKTYRGAKRLLQDTDALSIVDIGSQDGSVARELRKLAPGKKIFAFEVQPHFAPHLRHLKTKLKHFEFTQCETWDQCAFDQFNLEPDFIRIDVDQSQIKVLRSLEETISKFHPTLLLRYMPETWTENSDFLKDHCYDFYWYNVKSDSFHKIAYDSYAHIDSELIAKKIRVNLYAVHRNHPTILDLRRKSHNGPSGFC